MNKLLLGIVILSGIVLGTISNVAVAQDLDDILKSALKDYLEEKAEDAGIDISGHRKPKNVELKFQGAEPPSTDIFEALYTAAEEAPIGPVTTGQTAVELDCINRVQGKIAWNSNGSKRWNPRNIRKLCDGATVAAAPPSCFYHAMFRGSAWGQKPQHKMSWMLATQLCAKARDVNSPINCLNSRLNANHSLQSAVNACDANPRTIATQPRPKPTQRLQEAGCYDYVQGGIAWDAAGKNKRWNKSNVVRLCKATTSKYSPGNCFKYAMHKGSQWGKRTGDVMNWSKAIDLCEGTGNAKQTTTCFKAAIAAGRSVDQAVARCDR